MKKIILLLLVSFSITLSLSCGGGSSSNSGIGKNDLEPVKASINLRLGQVSRVNSPVAVSAALENGESFVVFNKTSNDEAGTSVAYNNLLNQTLLVDFDSTGRPKQAKSLDAELTFSNYTKNTVDVTISTINASTARVKSTSRTLTNQPIDQENLLFLDGDTMIRILLGLDSDSDSGTRALLATALSSLKIVGCLSDELIAQFESFEGFSPEILRNVTSGVCGSELLESVEEILDNTDYEEITVIQNESPAECEAEFSFENALVCSVFIGDQTEEAAENGYVDEFPVEETTEEDPSDEPTIEPTIEPSLEPSPEPSIPQESPIPTNTISPSETPSASKSPTPLPSAPSSFPPSPPASPLPNQFLGSWSGVGIGSTNQTGCRTHSVNLNIFPNSDITCTPPNKCGVTGSFIDSENILSFGTLSGTMDNIGHITLSGTGTFTFTSFTLTATGTLNSVMGSNSGVYSHDMNGCTGVFTITKN